MAILEPIQDQRPHSATTEQHAALMGRVADCFRINGATPEQAEAMAEIDRIFAASPDRAGLAQRVLDLIEADRCQLLDGQCTEHTNDHGEIIHRGPESSITAGNQVDLLPFHLVQWGNDKPYIVYGWEADELDLSGVDAAIEAEQKHLAALVEARAHLAEAIQTYDAKGVGE